jgi:hypothetical protein
MQYINTEILITEMEVSNETKNIIPLKFLRKIKKFFFSSCEPNPGTYGMLNLQVQHSEKVNTKKNIKELIVIKLTFLSVRHDTTLDSYYFKKIITYVNDAK